MATIRKYVGKSGVVSYQVQVRKAGARPVSASFARLSDAKEWIAQEETRLLRRQYGMRADGSYTMAQAIDKFLKEELPKRSADDQSKYRMVLNWWADEIGYIRIRSISPQDIQRGVERLKVEPKKNSIRQPVADGRTRSPATIKQYLAVLSVLFSTGMKRWDGWFDENPVSRVEKPKLDNARTRYLSGYLYLWPGEKKPRHWDEVTDEEKGRLPKEAYELPRFLEACCKQIIEAEKPFTDIRYRHLRYHPEWLYNLVVIRVSTGLRSAEAEGLRWSNMDLFMMDDIGRATIKKTKNGDPVTVALTGHALHILQQMHEVRDPNCDWVFPRPDKQKPLHFRKRYVCAIEDAGLEDFRPHDLRHTAGSYLAMAGGTLPEIMAALNHKTPQMTKRYMHLSPAHTAGLVGRMNDAVFGARSGESRFDAANDNRPSARKTVI